MAEHVPSRPLMPAIVTVASVGSIVRPRRPSTPNYERLPSHENLSHQPHPTYTSDPTKLAYHTGGRRGDIGGADSISQRMQLLILARNVEDQRHWFKRNTRAQLSEHIGLEM